MTSEGIEHFSPLRINSNRFGCCFQRSFVFKTCTSNRDCLNYMLQIIGTNFLSVNRTIVKKYSQSLVDVHNMKKVNFFKFFFFQIFDRYIYAQKNKNTCHVKEAWKWVKENIFTDIFNGFDSAGKLMKWFDLQFQVFRWQPCSKSALFLFYANFVISWVRSTQNKFISSILAMNTLIWTDIFLVLRNQK